MTAVDLFDMIHAASLPEGWEVDFGEEGGQPNGLNKIEPSDWREWFSDERESHHRQRIVLIGPWEEGPREHIRVQVEAERRSQVRAAQAHEEHVLREADAIRASRAEKTALDVTA